MDMSHFVTKPLLHTNLNPLFLTLKDPPPPTHTHTPFPMCKITFERPLAAVGGFW